MRVWTDQEIETIKRLFAEGKTDLQIAKAMGLTKGQVCGKRGRLKIKRESVKVEEKSNIVAIPKRRGRPKKDDFIHPENMPLIPLLDIKDGQCREVIDGQICCGLPTFNGSIWCQAHAQKNLRPANYDKLCARDFEPEHRRARILSDIGNKDLILPCVKQHIGKVVE